MRLKDVRLEAIPHPTGNVSIEEVESGNLIGELWPIPGLNKRQLLIVAQTMCDVYNADQMYTPLEKKG